MKKNHTQPIYFIFLLFFFLFNFLIFNLHAQEDFSSSNLISTGEIFPELKLSASLTKEDLKYLGLNEKTDFNIKDIKADLILVEILNTFCFSCQKQAPVYNELFQKLQGDPRTKDRVKMLGIAVGNTKQAIDVFKATHKVNFPITPDENFKIYEAVGGARTPFTVYLRKDDAYPNGIVVKNHLGVSYRYDIIFQDMLAMLSMDKNALASISKIQDKKTAVQTFVKPLITDDQTIDLLTKSIKEEGKNIKEIKKIELATYSGLFSIKTEEKNEVKSIIAHIVSKPPTCGVCHDIHFIYTFDSEGKIIGFYPIQLTKYGNVPWDKNDLDKIKKEIIGKYIAKPWEQKPDVQVVTSATITTTVILHNISMGEKLFRDLKDKKYL